MGLLKTRTRYLLDLRMFTISYREFSEETLEYVCVCEDLITSRSLESDIEMFDCEEHQSSLSLMSFCEHSGN